MAGSLADKPTLEVGIIAVLTVVVNNALPIEKHVIYTTLVSPLGWSIGWLIRWLRRRHNFNQLLKQEQKWIDELLAERNLVNTTARRKKEISADINQRRAAMQQATRERYKVEQ